MNATNCELCELCNTDGGQVLWRDARCRVVLVSDADYVGYCRLIWNTHVAEMSDLSAQDHAHCMQVVLAAEVALRDVIKPDKINLASLGNFTPHVHWHVIPRFRDDAHFPQAIWGERQRVSPARRIDAKALRVRLAQVLSDPSRMQTRTQTVN